MSKIKESLDPTWHKALEKEFKKSYWIELKNYLEAELKNGFTIYPKSSDIFKAFNLCPINKVKVVIVGQDPYHGPGQANGLSFSVPEGVKPPPSLANIYKELAEDIGKLIPKSGDLTPWADQGVLMLNAILTVRSHTPASHRNRGWEIFTDTVIQTINNNCDGVVFVLWGNYAKEKGKRIDTSRHFIINSPHPSPFSAYNGFFGSRPFSQANRLLISQKKEPINW
jgi:uracil-DNA glycosylase